MCRWIAYSGKPIYLDTLITLPEHSLVAQSLNAKMRYKSDGSIKAINGDGIGIGWYGKFDEPGLFKVADPAWSNENIHEICTNTKAHVFMSHIREATTGAVQRSNTHPFKYRNWLFQHNGAVRNFEVLRRDLMFAISEELFPLIKGNTDSEVLFFLALTYGLEKDPKSAIEKTIARIKQACQSRNIAFEMILSIAISNGVDLYTARYAEGIRSSSQFYSTHAQCMKAIGNHTFTMSPGDVVVVSEPLNHSLEHWQEMPNSSFAAMKDGKIKIAPLALS